MSKLKIGLVLMLALSFTACASDPNNMSARRTSNYQCPAGQTLICEVTNTGRIHHGSFSKRGSNCACQIEGTEAAPNVPAIQQ